MVFSNNMNKLNTDDVKQSLNIIENYIRYMQESIEFNNRNINKETIDEIKETLKNLDARVSALENQ